MLKGILWAIICVNTCFAQRIDTYSSLAEIPTNSFIRLNYDNDLFRLQDIYYSQGLTLEIVHPSMKKNPINHLFLHPIKSDKQKNGVRFESTVYTPSTILSDSILLNDRSYASILALEFYEFSYQSIKTMKLISSFQIGIIGPAAMGREIQTGIHRVTNNSLPLGWQHQIKNDLLLNYNLRVDKQLFHYKTNIALNGIGSTDIGSYQTNFSLGIDLSLGKKNNTFLNNDSKFQAYIYGQSQIKLIGYDASLMGGMFHRSSDNTLSYSSISKIVNENHLGITLLYDSFSFGVDFGWISKEFDTGSAHSWGGIRIAFGI